MSKNKKSLSDRWAVFLPETLACFTSIYPSCTPTKIMAKQLLRYSVPEIIEAQAAFHAQKSKHPEKHYGEEYFFGILRHKRNERAKIAYSDVFRAGIALKSKLPSPTLSPAELRSEIIRFLIDLEDEKSPLHKRYHLHALMFFLVSASTRLSLQSLWKGIVDGMVRSNFVSERWLSTIIEFAYEHIGDLLYERALQPIANQNYDSATTARERKGAERF